jgi:mycothiol synthase
MEGWERIYRGVLRRLTWLMKGCPKTPPLLEMVWPESLLASPPTVSVEDGYNLRQYTDGDQDAYFNLLTAAGMEQCSFKYWEKHILPNGFYLIECDQTKDIVAACFASHHPTVRHVRAGNFGWLAADPKHSGRGLGKAVSSAVTARLVNAGYEQIFLETHDYRLPAIKIYLSMGWVPLLYCEEMYERWKSICEELKWPYTPEQWKSK